MSSSRPVNNCPPELRERAVRMVPEVRGEYASDWAAAASVTAKLGVGTPQTVLDWVRKPYWTGSAKRRSMPGSGPVRRLRAEVKQLRLANDILKTASAFFAAAELDRRLG
jgi:transposase